jgi:hypothetical protein
MNIVLAGGYIMQIADGIAERSIVNHERLARLHALDVHPEDHLGADRIVDLHAGFGGRIGGQKKKDAAVEWLLAAALGKGNGETRTGVGCR